jgi:hypothetical protein
MPMESLDKHTDTRLLMAIDNGKRFDARGRNGQIHKRRNPCVRVSRTTVIQKRDSDPASFLPGIGWRCDDKGRRGVPWGAPKRYI